MASLNVDLAESEALSSTTVPVTPADDGDGEARLITGIKATGTTPSFLRRPSDNGGVANEASNGKTDHEMDDQSQVLSKVRRLQDELVKVERSARLGQRFENIERRWDSELERLGGDLEQRNWAMSQQMRAQSFAKDTTAFALSRAWAHESEDSFIWNMLEREEQDKWLTERRAQWEAKTGVTKPKADDVPNPAWPPVGPHRSFQYPAFLDPLSNESRFNNTNEARGYDFQENQLRFQIHEIVRQKHDAFMRWKRTPMPPPEPRDTSYHVVWPRPIVSYVPWKVFKYCSPSMAFSGDEKKDLFAIDVLEGEPDLSVTRESYDLLMRTMRQDRSKLPDGIPKMASGLLPERIRLNGPQFAQTFCALGCDDYSSNRAQLVLLQPFRLLVYYDQEIRKRYAVLREKLKVSSNQRDTSRTSTPQAPEHERPGQSDGEKMHHESTDASAQPSQDGETDADSGHQARDATEHEEVDEPQLQPEDKPSEENEEMKFPLASTTTALEYLDCLISFMDRTISIRRKYIQGPDCRKIQFRDLWYLFNPGDEVIRHDEKQVYRVIEVTNPTHRASSKNIFFNFDDEDHSRYFQLSCVFVDFDGKRIGPVSTSFVIKAFAGERSVESLEVYPLRLHRNTPTATHERKGRSATSEPQTLRQQLIKRGKKFFQAACMKLENTFYDGPTAGGDEVESQVVVDFETALSSDNNFHEHLVPQLESLLGDADDSSTASSVYGGAVACMASCCDTEFICDDNFVDEKRKEEYIDSLIPKNTYAKLPSVAIYPRTLDDTTGDNALTDDEFLLMSYRVFAFVLRTRKWAELDLAYMEDATESDAQPHDNKDVSQPAFDQLVLPEGHKSIVLSLISQHYRNRDSGRRKGLILLLHGAPGVGKTSTAEGIAEKFKKPLFTITCGDLGSTAKEVEQALDLHFNLANRWGCILLLDEADVFLSSRTETDFERNGLVAVFLRVLEYYAGILFLTTNRVGVIDEAFRSRIHISLYYPPLGYDETRAVFRLNLKLVEDRFRNDKRNIKIERVEIIDFALDYFRAHEKARWNGRQIRNACQTALALAEFKAQGGNHDTVLDPNADVCLAVDNFKTVSKAYLEFTKYLKQLYGIHEDVRAKELGLRARETFRQPQAQSMHSPVFGGNINQPGSDYGHAQHYNSASLNPTQSVQGQSYQPASMMGSVHMNPNVVAQQPGQQAQYYGNPAQVGTPGNFNTYGASGQALSGQMSQQGQEFGGMQFQPAHVNMAKQAQPWLVPASPPNSAITPQTLSVPAQQQSPGTTHLGSQVPTSQPFQAQQFMPAQQSMQQQAPQTWYPNMNVQALQPPGGQNPPGPSHQEEGR
ncbi:hypothetical protein LA080_002392 [Diaporthe eres]|nr:hypothetical protein LA080_002392 [Diaporthe eres]